MNKVSIEAKQPRDTQRQKLEAFAAQRKTTSDATAAASPASGKESSYSHIQRYSIAERISSQSI